MFMLGSLFVAVVLLLPDGLISIPEANRRTLAPACGDDEARGRSEDDAAGSGRRGRQPGQSSHRCKRTCSESVSSAARTDDSRTQHRSLLDSELVRVENVKVLFDGFKALDVDKFSIDYYELQVVIGPNGAGKTTLCDVISGKTRPTSGQIFFGKREITQMPEVDIARLGVGRKFQTPSIFDGLTVFESMELALPGRQSPAAELPVTKPAPSDRDRIHEILKRVRLERRSQPARASISATASGNGWRSACCSWPARTCCWSTSRPPDSPMRRRR